MEYTVNDITYHGFARLCFERQVHSGVLMVIAWFDGEPELWMVEGDESVAQLRDYYRADWGDRSIPFQLFVARGAV